MEKGATPVQCAKCYTLNPNKSPYCSKCGSSLSDGVETVTCGERDEPAGGSIRHFKPGQVFDRRYRIIEEIGRGGMGCVFKAEDTDLDITVALKIIRPHLSSNPRFIEQFKKEMLLARAISHENVIRIFDLGEAPGVKYISMEFIKGENLKDFLHTSGTLTIETVINLARQIGEALKVAHAKGIVHQDLKPSNIMIDQSGRAYIMDFGLATAVYVSGAGRPGEGAGTPQYMSPEQAAGERTGPASDIYSFGTILYEMATGKAVFEAGTRAEYKKKHISEKPVPPAKLNPHVSKPLERLILKCLNKDPAKRYLAIADMLGDLSRVPGAGTGSIFEWLKRRWAQGLTAVCLAAVAALVYLIWIKAPSPPEKRLSLAVMYLTNNTGDKNLDYMRRTLSELLIFNLLQSQYVRVLTADKIYGILKDLNLLDAPTYTSEELRKVAAKAQVDYILQGSFSGAKEQFRVNASLHRAATMEVQMAEREQWTGDEGQYAMAVNLTRKIKVGLKLPAAAVAGDIQRDLRTITTGSTEAFKYYTDGKRLFEEQKFEQSLKALDQAVALDPEFAMAYRLMAEGYNYLMNGEQYKKSLGKALSLLNRVSDREFYMIRGFAAVDDAREAIAMYKKLLQLYPDDLDALGELGAQYRNIEEWQLAAQQFEKVLTIDGSDELAHENLALIYMAQGSLQKAIDLLESKLTDFSGWFSYHNRLAMAYLCAHRYDRALEEAGRAVTLGSSDFEPIELVGLIHLVQGNTAQAESTFQQMIHSQDPQYQTHGWPWLGHLFLMCGRYGQVLEVVKAGLAHARTAEMSSDFRASEIHAMSMLAAYAGLQMNALPRAYEDSGQALEAARASGGGDFIQSALHIRGIILAKMKRFEEARAVAAELRESIEKSGGTNELRLYHRLSGEISRERGDLTEAIASFETALKLLPEQNYKTNIHILFLDSLASAYYQQGDRDQAQKAYEKIVDLTAGRVRWGDLYAKSYYWLGKIHQSLDRGEKAVESYRRFLEIWKLADPGLPETVDARKQIAALGAESPI